MRDYILQVSFDASEADVSELVHAALFLTPSRGSTTEEVEGKQTISAYFDSAQSRDAAARALEGVPVRLAAIERERVDWLERYAQSLRPMDIGERFLVAPDASLLPNDGSRLQIVVPQEQAFGTGSHETTALCITLLESTEVAGARGLDIGSGSGILAIAMIRLGARKVIAFDHDPDAYGALRDNRRRNDVREESLAIFIGGLEALRGGTFDVLTMNIIPEVIVPLLPQVRARMSVSARLIVSGVLVERREELVAAARSEHLHLGREATRGEWWAGVFQHARSRTSVMAATSP